MAIENNDGVLYLKYRPTSLEDMVGNKQVISVLDRLLSGEGGQPFPHSILFHGPTGCGKTTLARIVACRLGAKGGDVVEIDSADFRGIDTIRSIRSQCRYQPLEGACRVWILDEVHRATNDAQSALLKVLEDTPSHVYFILCTTDPQKLLPTILGRCAQFQVTPLNENEMRVLLRRVVKAEGESLDKALYNQIARDSLGRPRNALQILAQVVAAEPEQRLEVARRSAELQSETIELCRALLNGSPWKKISNILKGLADEDPESVRRAVLGYCQSVLLSGQRNDRAAMVIEEFLEPFYQSGRAGLVYACYSIMFGE